MKDDRIYIEKILSYCTKIEDDCERFGLDIESYFEDRKI